MRRKKRPIRESENPNRAEKLKETGKSADDIFLPGDIVIYNSIVEDAWRDENDGKVYLCLGDAGSEELSNIGNILSGSFSDLRIIAVLEDDGDVKFVLQDELSPAGVKNE
jgi:hypothetical protein